MTDLHELAKPDIEAASDFTPDLSDLQRRADGIRRHRRVASWTGLAGILSVGAFAVAMAVSAGPATVDTAGSPQSSFPGLGLAIERIEARGGESGTEEVTITFDAPIPAAEVTTVDDIATVSGSTLAVVIQDAAGVRVCDSTHSFPDSPGGSGSVDLLIPSQWLADGVKLPGVTPLVPTPDKVIVCGPYEGHVQISIWGAAPMPGERLVATVSPDRTKITVTVDVVEDVEADGEAVVAPAQVCEALYGTEPWLVLFQETPPSECVVVAEYQDLQVWNKGYDDTVVDWIDGRRTLASDSSFSTGPIGDLFAPGVHDFAGSPYALPAIHVLSEEDSPAAGQPTDVVEPGMTLQEAQRAYGLDLAIDPNLMSGPQCWAAVVPGDPYSPFFIVRGPQSDQAIVVRVLSVTDQSATPEDDQGCDGS